VENSSPSPKLSLIIQMACLVLPWPMRRFVLSRLLKFQLDPSCHIGLSLIDAQKVRLGKQARIGHFNWIKGLEEFALADTALIGNFNYCLAVPKTDDCRFQHCLNRYPSLALGRGAAITSRHFFDCNDAIEIGAMTTIAGASSQFWTHEIDVATSQQRTKPIQIGAYCYVGTRALVLAGAVVPFEVVIAAGAVVRSNYANSRTLLAGNPAVEKKQWQPGQIQYFERSQPAVD
jgi:acetyltransferase-like isoleucine patch superfamily enzyme